MTPKSNTTLANGGRVNVSSLVEIGQTEPKIQRREDISESEWRNPRETLYLPLVLTYYGGIISRLTLLHKALHQKVSIPLPSYIQQPSRQTRQYHRRRFMRLGSSNDKYKYSFFPRTLTDWNNLPENLIEIDDSEKFKTSITLHFDTSSDWADDVFSQPY